MREFRSGSQLFVRETVSAGGSNRKRTFRIYQSLNLLFDAFPLGEHNAHFTDAIPKPRRKPRRFEIQKGKARAGEIEHRTGF